MEWKPEWKAIFYTLMYNYFARKRDACVEIHPLMYTYLIRKRVAHVEWKKIYNISPSFQSMFPKWNRKQCNIFLVLKSCNPSRMQSDIIFLVLKCFWLLGEWKEKNLSLGILNGIQIALWKPLLAKFCQNRHFCQIHHFCQIILPAFQGPSSWVNLFTIIISSTTLAKFRQNRHFRQIHKHFRALVAGLIYSLLSFSPKSPLSSNSPTFQNPCSWFIYSLLSFCQQPWWNFARIAIFATGCISGHIW